MLVSTFRTLSASRSEVWDALVVGERRQQWWPGLDFEARAGARLDESWKDEAGAVQHTRGTIRKVEPQLTLQFEWVDAGWAKPSTVTIRLADEGTGARISIDESGLLEASGDRALAAEHRQGWELHLRDLSRYLEEL